MKRMNASRSFLVPKKGARSKAYSLDMSLLDDDQEASINANHSFADVSFQMENEMEISNIQSESPRGGDVPAKDTEILCQPKEEETNEQGNITGNQNDTPNSNPPSVTYADKVKPNSKDTADTGESTDQPQKKKLTKYKFTAEELMDLEAEVEQLKKLKDPVQWLKATQMSMQFIEHERTTTIIYIAEREALPVGMRTPEVIKQFRDSIQSTEVQDVMLRGNIAYFKKMGTQKLALSIKTKEDVQIMSRQTLKIGTSKFVPWTKPAVRLGNVFQPFTQKTTPEEKGKLKIFKERFYLTVFEAPEADLVHALSYIMSQKGCEITSFVSTFQDEQTGIKGDTFRMAFKESQRPDCLKIMGGDAKEQYVNQIKVGNRLISFIGSDVQCEMQLRERNSNTKVQVDWSQDFNSYFETKKDQGKRPLPDFSRRDINTETEFQAADKVCKGKQEQVQPTDILSVNRFETIAFEDEWAEVCELQDTEQNISFIQPKISVLNEEGIPMPKVEFTELIHPTTKQSYHEIKYHVEHINSNDLSQLMSKYSKVDQKIVEDHQRANEGIGQIQKELKGGVQNVCTPILAKIMSDFPISSDKAMRDAKTITGAAFQKFIWVHAFNRSLAESNGHCFQDLEQKYKELGLNVSDSVAKIHKTISERMSQQAKKHEEKGQHILQKWDQCLMAALTDILGRVIHPQGWMDIQYMAIMARHFPKLIPVCEGILQYDDLTLCRLQKLGGCERYYKILEQWHKKSWIIFMKKFFKQTKPWILSPIEWTMHEDGIQIALSEQESPTSGNSMYDSLHQGTRIPKRI